MKKSFFKRLASAFMAGVMMFTSNSFGIKTFSDNVNSPAGVGIYNHVLTEDSSAKTKYVLYFYKNFGTELVAPSNDLLNLSSLNLSSYQGEENQDGVSVYVDANNNLILSNDNAFKEFVNDYHIDKIRIEYVTEMIDGKNTSLLYKDNVAEEYEFYELVHGDNGEPDTLKDILNYNQENPFENINETLKVYDSTRMKDVIVEQEWHDRGGDKRPSIKNLKFDLIQNTNDSYLTNFEYVNSAEENPNLYTYTASGEEDEVTVYLELENKDSITYQYIYTVPECAPDGTVYNYSSKLSDTTQLNQDDYKTVDTQTVNKYKAIGLTSFNFTLNWEDDYDPTARPIIDADFIKNNFTLYKRVKTTDENGNTIYTGTVLTDEEKNDMIIETDGDTVTIKRLVDISEVGTANEYYLQINNAQSKLSVNQKDYSNSVDKLNDYYAVKSENHGVHAHETDKTYDNGDFTLRLTGKVSFTGNVIWDDIDTATIRQQDEDAASFDLWRYAGNDIDYSAKVGSPLTIAGKPDGAVTQEEMKTNTFTFGLDENNNYTLDKYDVNGQLYTYYAKETVSVEKTGAGETGNYPYQWTYSNNAPDESVTNKLLNGGTVINKLSDKIQYTVSAQWIAAARQGGTAEATYQLQIYDKTQNKWIPVQTPKKDNDGNIVYQNAEVTLNFDELHMSRETDDLNKFPEVDLYDESGVMNHYRVVQTQIKRTDNLISQTDEDDIGLTIAGNTTTEQNEIDVNDKYFVTLTKNGTNFDFKYRIKGNTYVRIEKIWLAEDHKTILNTATLTEQPPYTAVFDVQNFSNS